MNRLFKVRYFQIVHKIQIISSQLNSIQNIQYNSTCRCFSSGQQLSGWYDFWRKQEPIVENKSNLLVSENVAHSDSTTASETSIETTAVTSENADVTISSVEKMSDVMPASHDFSLWPEDIVQDILRLVHDSAGIEWCTTIAIATVCLRLLTLPTYALVRGHSIRSANLKPDELRISQKLQEASARGDKIQGQHYQLELMEFWKTHNTSPVKALLYQLPNGLLFCSVFLALRNMAKIPLPSMVDAGYFWFPNLTIPDPYFILPALSCATMFILIKTGGADADMGPMANEEVVKKFIQFMPIIAFPFICMQPAAIATYWLTNNMITFLFINGFKTKPVKKFFGLPEMKKHSEKDLKIINEQFSNLFKRNKKQTGFEQRLQQHKKMIETSSKKKE